MRNLSLHQKMRSYNETVKRKYGPVVSKSKASEIVRRKKSLEVPAREKYRPKNDILSDQEKKKQIYLERMKYYDQQHMSKKHSSTPNLVQKQEPIDYLREFRSKNESQERVVRDRGMFIMINFVF